MTMFAFNALAPWLSLVDQDRFNIEVQRFADLGIDTIISAHSPSITGSSVAAALETMRSLPSTDCPPAPDQSVLDLIVAATQAP
jgi:hypothetical protein